MAKYRCQEIGDVYQIAYGHHRVEAAKRLGRKEMPVRGVLDIDDATVLKGLGQENMEEMAGSPIWAMEIVKTTIQALREERHVPVQEKSEPQNIFSI